VAGGRAEEEEENSGYRRAGEPNVLRMGRSRGRWLQNRREFVLVLVLKV
jgi:hypothetical protein